MSAWDVAFVGSSPNALVAAARLAKSGSRVLVLETRAAVGGPVATEAFAPGFRADSGLASVALDPEVARALDVSVEALRRESVTWLGTRPTTLRAMPELGAPFRAAVDLLRAIYQMVPPDVPAPSGPSADTLDDIGARLRGLGPREMHEVLRLAFMPARDFLQERVDSEPVRALLAGAAVRGLSEGPFASGTLFGLLHHEAVGDGLFRSSARGGVGKVSEAIAEAARAAGAELRTSVVGPIRVEVQDGIARGLRLGDGSSIAADRIVSDHDGRKTFTELVSPTELDPEVNATTRRIRYRGSVARVRVALKGLPEAPGIDPAALRGTLVAADDVASLERAWDQAKRGVTPSRPYVEATVPTLADPSLAPDGAHVLDAWVQYVPRGRADRQALLDCVLDRLAPLSPRLRDLVLHHEVALPEDLERRFGLTEGQLYGGEVRLDQCFFLRPLPGESSYRTPIVNLYLGGSAAHPGGYSGRSGWNLAGALLSAQGE